MKFLKHSFILTGMLAFAGMLFFSCKNDMEKIASLKLNDTIPIESAVDVEYLYSENAILKTRMTAPLMNRYEMPEAFLELPQGFLIEMFDSAGVMSSSITAKWARKYEQKKLMEAKYNVVVNDFVENKTLNTNYLIWDEANDRIYSDQFVKITTPDKIIYGDGFESDQSFSDYRIIQPKGEILLTRSKENTEEE